MYFAPRPSFSYHGSRIRQPAVREEGMEEKPVGALGVVAILALVILVFWFGVLAVFLARG
jgi:cytochrome b